MKQSETLKEGVHRQAAVQWCRILFLCRFSLLLLFFTFLINSSGQTVSMSHTSSQSVMWVTGNGNDLLSALPFLIVPDQVSLQLPDDEMSGIPLNPSLEWLPVDEVLGYDIQISENNSFSELIVNESLFDSTFYTLSTDLDYGTTYFWRVRAVDESGEGEWSVIWQFTTIIAPPESVILESPDNNSTGIELSPFFDWEAAARAENYEFQLALENTFEEPLINLQEHTLNYFQLPVELEYLTDYYWRVRASNSTGDSEWSDIWSFTTLIAPPAPITISYPLNGVENVDLLPEISWETGTRAESYDLRVSEQVDLSDPVIDETGLTENSYQSSDELEYNQTYYWQVRGVNSTGPGEWSEVVSFRTKSPDSFALDQNFPNPFSNNGSGTTIRFRIPDDGRVRMYLHDSTGRRAATIVDEEMIAGEHEITFYGRNLAPTIYYYTLIYDQQQTTKTLIILN